jgi:hypothetical protein
MTDYAKMAQMRAIAGQIGNQLDPTFSAQGLGFFFVVFPVGGKEMGWITNAEAKEMAKSLREIADKIEHDDMKMANPEGSA